MTLPGFDGLREYGQRGPTRVATVGADAGQGPGQGATTEAGVWSYEPKWDGFRALVFRDGDKVVLQSRNGKELGRYFPELRAGAARRAGAALRARRGGGRAA